MMKLNYAIKELKNKGVYAIRNTRTYYYVRARTSDIYRSNIQRNPLKPIKIPPESVARHSPIRYSRKKELGSIKGGDWDRLENQQKPEWCDFSFENHPLYEAMLSRFRHGKEWKSTAFIQKAQEDVKNNGKGWYGKCRSIEDIENRCQYLETLYNSINKEGYSFSHTNQNNDIAAEIGSKFFDDPYHEITVNFDRNGEILFNGDGRHRLFITKILDLDQIPVMGVVWHEEFVNTMNENEDIYS